MSQPPRVGHLSDKQLLGAVECISWSGVSCVGEALWHLVIDFGRQIWAVASSNLLVLFCLSKP
jgi:hypothetical protein